MANDNMPSAADVSFTVEMSRKMTVPEHLSYDPKAHKVRYDDTGYLASKMEVPDRILIAGGDTHMGAKEQPREIYYDRQMFGQPVNPLALETPPRHLTLTQQNFPSVQEELEGRREKMEQRMRQLEGRTSVGSGTHPDGPYPETDSQVGILAPEAELKLLRRHVTRLTSRLYNLEQKMQYHGQRDSVLMWLGVGYFAIKMIFFLRGALRE